MAALLTDYRSGSSLRDLQRSYALGRGSVQWLLREAGVRRRRGSLTHNEVAALVERYKHGFTIREIAKQLGLPKTTVQDALARTNVAKRPAARRNSPFPFPNACDGPIPFDVS